MIRRYVWVFKRHIFYLLLLTALVIASTQTTGKTAVTLTIIAGAVMIFVVIRIVMWLLKTDTKEDKSKSI